jgi:hypothetical protein
VFLFYSWDMRKRELGTAHTGPGKRLTNLGLVYSWGISTPWKFGDEKGLGETPISPNPHFSPNFPSFPHTLPHSL